MIASMSAAPLIVLGFAPLAGQPDISPFVSKLEVYLRLAGVEYSKQPGDPPCARPVRRSRSLG